MAGHAPNILYGNAYYRTMEDRHSPILEWRPIHVEVCKLLRTVYGLTMAQANDAVVKFRQQIIDEQDDGHDVEEVSHILYRLLRFRGDV